MRFPEFSGEWVSKTIGDIAPLQRGFDLPTGQINNGKFPVVYSNGIMNYHSSYKCVAPGLITGRSGTIGKFTYIEDGYYWPHNTSLWVTDFYDNNPKFIYYLYQTIRIEQYSTGSGVPTLNRNNVHRHKTFIPKLKEQNKIATILSLLDERIATQTKIIEDLKKLKSALSHILFSSKCTNHFSYIADVVMGQSPSSNAYNDQCIGMPLVQGNLDISNGKTTPRLYTAEFNQTAEEGNIILTVRAPVGEVAKATKKVCLGRGVCAIIPHEENMSDFIYQYLTFYKFMWRRYEQGSTFTSINGSDVRNILCPEVRNVSILTLLDEKISTEERTVKLYQLQKLYMLYQMFI